MLIFTKTLFRSACYTNERQHHVQEQPTIHFENDFDKNEQKQSKWQQTISIIIIINEND